MFRRTMFIYCATSKRKKKSSSSSSSSLLMKGESQGITSNQFKSWISGRSFRSFTIFSFVRSYWNQYIEEGVFRTNFMNTFCGISLSTAVPVVYLVFRIDRRSSDLQLWNRKMSSCSSKFDPRFRRYPGIVKREFVPVGLVCAWRCSLSVLYLMVSFFFLFSFSYLCSFLSSSFASYTVLFVLSFSSSDSPHYASGPVVVPNRAIAPLGLSLSLSSASSLSSTTTTHYCRCGGDIVVVVVVFVIGRARRHNWVDAGNYAVVLFSFQNNDQNPDDKYYRCWDQSTPENPCVNNCLPSTLTCVGSHSNQRSSVLRIVEIPARKPTTSPSPPLPTLVTTTSLLCDFDYASDPACCRSGRMRNIIPATSFVPLHTYWDDHQREYNCRVPTQWVGRWWTAVPAVVVVVVVVGLSSSSLSPSRCRWRWKWMLQLNVNRPRRV